MTETELKFQIPPRQSAAVARAVATATARRMRLVAAYADTADRRLAAAGLALRLRREGRQWVQTLKGRGDGLLVRPEHEVPVSAMPAQPAFDAARHAGTPVGELLLRLLADGAVLEVIYRTDVQRTLRLVRCAGATIELAHDCGRIEAAGQSIAVDELEFEMKSGSPAVLPVLAQRWVQRHGLWWDVRTKSERGFRLAEGRPQVAAVRAGPSRVATGMTSTQVLATMLADCLAQVLPNAAELAAAGLPGPADEAPSGSALPEQLHQLRVGLRRLRSVLREAATLAQGDEAQAAVRELERDWAEPFRLLGAARDADALAASLWPELDRALAAASLPLLDHAGSASEADCGEVVRSVALQSLLMRTLAIVLAPPPEAMPDEPEAPFGQDEAAALLQPLWKRVRRGARDLAAREPEQLHKLRRRAKRLRYLLEALAPLLRRKALARFVDDLRQAMDRLGELNDLHTAELALRARIAPTPSVWFALGYLAARRRALLPAAQRALDRAFADPAPWR